MSRVLILHHSLERGGAETQLMLCLEALRSRADSILVLYSLSKLDRIRLQEFPTVRIRTLNGSDMPHPLRFFVRLVHLSWICIQYKPDTLLSYLVGTNITNLLVGKLLRIHRIVWGLRVTPIADNDCSRFARLLERLFVLLSPNADLLISNSHQAWRQYQQLGMRPKALSVIPNGVDLSVFREDIASRARARTRFTVDTRTFVIGCTSRLVPWKGHKFFLEAAAKVLAVHPNCKFVLAGDGPRGFKKELFTLQNALGIPEQSVLWLGTQGNIAQLLNGFDLFTLMSTSGEALSNSLIEAIATSLPVVVTDVGDSARIVGKLGIVVKSESSNELAAAWMRIIDNYQEAKADAKQLQQLVAKNMDSKEALEKFIQAVLGTS